MTRFEPHHLSRWPPAQRAARRTFVPGNRRWDNDGVECGCNRRRIETIGVQKHLHFPSGQKRALTGWTRAWGWRTRILRLSGRATVNNERLIESPAQKAGSSKTKKPGPSSPHSDSLFHNGNCSHKIQKESVFTSRPSPQGRIRHRSSVKYPHLFFNTLLPGARPSPSNVRLPCSNSF
jgi:hypothetical protein